nr:Ribose transport system permease protein RbsC [Candidatus Pantoea persica]
MMYTYGSPINTGFNDNADLFGWFGIGRPLGIPTPVWLMAIVFLLAWYMLHHARLGRYIYALGGTGLAGGKGRIMGTLILGFLNNGLNLMGVSSYYQMIVKAVVILLAVLVDNKSSK